MNEKINEFKTNVQRKKEQKYTCFGYFDEGYKDGSKVYLGPCGAFYYISSKTFNFVRCNKTDTIHIKLKTLTDKT